MAAYSILEAKSNFETLVDKATSGEDVLIADPGKPILKLVPAELPVMKRRQRPAPGFAREMGFDIPALLKALDESWSEEEQRAFGMID